MKEYPALEGRNPISRVLLIGGTHGDEYSDGAGKGMDASLWLLLRIRALAALVRPEHRWHDEGEAEVAQPPSFQRRLESTLHRRCRNKSMDASLRWHDEEGRHGCQPAAAPAHPCCLACQRATAIACARRLAVQHHGGAEPAIYSVTEH